MSETIETRLPAVYESVKDGSDVPWEVFRRLQYIARVLRAAPDDTGAAVRLLWLNADGTVGTANVTSTEIVVGREAGGHVVLPGRRVSRRHCAVRRIAGGEAGVEVEDLGAINGTWVNGGQLAPREKRLLRDGDVIEVGGTGLVVAIPGGE